MVLAVVIVLVYRGWLSTGPLTYGDWIYYSRLMLKHYFAIPFAWEPAFGLGTPYLIGLYWAIPQFFLWGLLATLHVPFAWSERLIWFFPCVLLAVFSSYYMGKTVFNNRKAACITTAAFVLSTYFLRLSTQGLENLGASFALAPLVLALLLRASRTRGYRYPVLAGLALWLQGSYDLRFCYLTVLIAIVGWIFLALGSVRRRREGLTEALRLGGYLVISIGIFIGASAFWILPNILGPGFQFPRNYGQVWWVPILSFGKLIHTFTMHEPGWPTLTFTQLAGPGHVAINPFFALIPIIGSVAALLALRGIKRDPARVRIALAGCALVIAGVFLAKGSNNPLGGFYMWLFNHLPGFNMFRDPNKVFLALVLGYSILFGLATVIMTELCSAWARPDTLKYALVSNSPAAVILLILCMLALPALSGHLGGVYGATRPVKVPVSYQILDRQLEDDNRYYRTFWFPDVQRFATMGALHPTISAKELSGGQLFPLALKEQPLSMIENPLSPGLLDAMAVQKLVVPEDADVPDNLLYKGEFRWENSLKKSEYKRMAGAVQGNTGSTTLGGITIYDRSGGRDHVFVQDKSISILGDWNSAQVADGTPGLDLNRCAYFISEEGKTTTPAFGKRFPTDVLLSEKPAAFDAIMPFVGREALVPVSDAAGQDAKREWVSISTSDYLPTAVPLLRSKDFNDRSLDYGLGGALGLDGYVPPPKDWLKQAKLLRTLDVGATPMPFFTSYEGLELKRVSQPGEDGGILQGSLSMVRNLRDPRIAYSDVIPAVPFHPYGIQFRVAGERLYELTCKISYFNAIGEWIGEKSFYLGEKPFRALESGIGTFDFTDVNDQFVTPADTSYCRFELDARESETYRSSWKLENANVYDLQGISKHPEFVVPVKVGKNGAYHLMIRCIGFEVGGRLALSVDGGKRLYVDTYSPAGRVTWFDLGKLHLAAGQHEIKVTNLVGENLVNTLALVTDEQLAGAERQVSEASVGRDTVCAIDLNRYPRSISYSGGRVTRSDSVYCPTHVTLVPTFRGNRDWAESGIGLRLGGKDFDLTSGVLPAGKPGWASLSEVTLPRGPCDYWISYPASSLVSLPVSVKSPGETAGDWQVDTDGVVLAADVLTTGEAGLSGRVLPGDDSVERVVRSKMVRVSGNTDYSALFNLEGKDCNTLFVSLKVFDDRGKVLDRIALTRAKNGTFAPETTFKKMKLWYGARFAALEIVFHANAKRPSSWHISGLLFNRASLVDPPIRKVVMMPRSLAFTASLETNTSPVAVEVLKSSPTKYKIQVSNAEKPFLMVFSERYAPDWELQLDGKSVSPVPVYTLLNSYPIYKRGSYEVTLTYRPQKWVNYGLVVTILTLGACLAFLIVNRYRRRSRLRKEARG